MLEIVRVLPEGTAARLGLESGDSVVSINDENVNDIIDFQFLSAEERLRLVVRRRDGSIRNFRLRKDPDDTLGIEFVPLRIKQCGNRCVFCFVDQMPRGCRKTLYIRDDDFRASFLYGNFVTLGALAESDWNRIFRQRLSPLYVSVHTTEPALRACLLRNKKIPPIIESLKRLAEGGIRMHTQIVLCPGINDGDHLNRTINDLSLLFPSVASIAVVPVGVTAFRKGLFALTSFSKGEARAVLDLTRAYGERFKKELGTRLVFPSDEFFIKAGETPPDHRFYEDFPQIENGVGMVAAFFREFSKTRLPKKVPPVKASIVTGVSFSRLFKSVADRLGAIDGLTVRTISVKNAFFGPSVTVTGLLTGGDILHALRGKRLGDLVVISSTMLKEDEKVFLDGMSMEQLERELKVKVVSVDGFKNFIGVLGNGGRQKK